METLACKHERDGGVSNGMIPYQLKQRPNSYVEWETSMCGRQVFLMSLWSQKLLLTKDIGSLESYMTCKKEHLVPPSGK